MDQQVRRVITGEAPDGKGVFTHVEDVEPLRLSGDTLRHIVWGWDEAPKLPYHEPGAYQALKSFPAGRPGAVQIETWVLPPRFPREGGDHHENCSRLHAYDTVDVVFVLEGEIDLEQSDGAVVRLRRGDVLVQNGAVHAWRNPTDERCVLGFVFFGTTRKGGADASSA